MQHGNWKLDWRKKRHIAENGPLKQGCDSITLAESCFSIIELAGKLRGKSFAQHSFRKIMPN